MAKTESTGKVKKFTYEVKDFEPNYKKNPLGKLIGVLVCLVVLALVFLVIFFASKGGKKKELTPDETVKEAISDCFSRLAGEKSPLIKGLGLEDYIKLLQSGRFGYRADLRLKEIKDFGLGFEEYASGVGVSFDGEADIKNHHAHSLGCPGFHDLRRFTEKEPVRNEGGKDRREKGFYGRWQGKSLRCL